MKKKKKDHMADRQRLARLCIREQNKNKKKNEENAAVAFHTHPKEWSTQMHRTYTAVREHSTTP